jgi:hypothetical protein
VGEATVRGVGRLAQRSHVAPPRTPQATGNLFLALTVARLCNRSTRPRNRQEGPKSFVRVTP